MRKNDFIHAIDSFKPDDNLKYRVFRKVEDSMKNQEIQVKKRRKVATFSICLVAVMGISMAMPVMADNTSLLDRLVAKVQQRNEVNPTKDYSVKVSDVTTITDDNQDVTTSEHCITPYIDSYYCDGNSLYITYGIKANAEDLAQCNCMYGGMDIKINGESLDDGEKSTDTFTASSDELGVFVGKINVDISNVENIEGATVDIDFRVNTAFDSIHQDFNYDNLYYEDRTRVGDGKYLDDVVSTSFEITSTNPQLDTYSVEQTQGGNTLHSVTVSPAGTVVDLDCQDGFYVLLHDNTGRELNWNSDTSSPKYETPMIGATSITVGLYNDTQSEAVYSFEVPIERGFNTGLDVANGQCYVDVEEVYTPPKSEVVSKIKSELENEVKDIPTVGEETFKYQDEDGGFDLSIDGYTIADNFDGLQVDNDASEYLDEDGNVKEGYKALIIEATITSTIDTEQEFYRQFSLNYSNIFPCFNEPVAFDDYENYHKSEYAITLQPNETRTMQIGFVIDEDALELPVVCLLGGYGDDTYSVRLK